LIGADKPELLHVEKDQVSEEVAPLDLEVDLSADETEPPAELR
jgi:hypothetical protein